MLAVLAAAVVAIHSLLMPARVVALATEGQWTSIAQGAAAHDCDRVSIWSVKIYRLGRRTSCGAPGHRIAALSEIDNRAVWLHVTGETSRTWTLWTATTKAPSPELLVRIRAPAGAPPPIVLGPGNTDRGQLSYGDGDVLPYAVGRTVTVLNARGERRFRWTAPSDVTAFATDAGILVIATADGTVFHFAWDPNRFGWVKLATYPGEAVSGVAYDGLGVLIQRGRTVTYAEPNHSCELPLRAGDRVAGGGGGRLAVVGGGRYRVVIPCGRTEASGTATSFSLDSNHFVTASGRRVTRHRLPGG